MFDPTKPADHSPNSAAEMRAQLNGLKALIDAVPAGPAGPAGPPGSQGEVSQQALDSAIMSTAINPTSMTTLSINISDPPTKGEVEAILGTLNTLISALQRQP